VEKRPSPAHGSKGANLHKILGGTAIILFLLVGRSSGQTRVLSLPQSTNSDRQDSASSSSNEPTIESKYKKQAKPKRDWCSLPDSKCLPQNTDQEARQTKRMFWVVPNFTAVSADTKLPPETPRQKFDVAMHDSVDYSSFVWTGILAGQSMGLKTYPELHQGAAGYARYYWRAFADQASGAMFTEAIVPTLTHEDPRYYTLGHGGFLKRTGYALSQLVLTRKDTPGVAFNIAEVGGNALVAGLSNAYYPPQERGLNKTVINWATQMESAGLNNIVKEFWPDIRRKVFRQK
jgi:hypothetical protein